MNKPYTLRTAAVLTAVAFAGSFCLAACEPVDLEQSTTAPKPDTAGITQQTLPDISDITQHTAPTAAVPQAPGSPPPLPEFSDIDPLAPMAGATSNAASKLDGETLHGILYAYTQNKTAVAEAASKAEVASNADFADAYFLGVTQYRAARQGVTGTFEYTDTAAKAVLAKAQLTIDDVSRGVAKRGGDMVWVDVPGGAVTDFKPDLVSREVNDKYSGTGAEYLNVYAYVTAAGTASRVTLITLEDGADVSVAGVM